MADPVHLHINAIDTLMFRDGRPFNQNDAGASEAVSVFPPYPPTVVGAVRAALWKQLPKWDTDKLGTGTNWQKDKLGPLKFGPPTLLFDGEPVFPVPLHILEGKVSDSGKEKELTRLAPESKPEPKRESDLGKAQLPVPKNPALLGVKPIEDRWVNVAGMNKILNGGTPDEDDFIKRTDLWSSEPRVGIGITPDTRTTTDGQLYMATHTRMADNVSLYVQLHGWGGKFETALRPLAGEHRMAQMESKKTGPKLPDAPTNIGDKYCVILMSPMVLENMPKPGENIGNLPGKLVSACTGKPVSIGGWDSPNKQPVPLRQCYPAGSVFFMQGGAPPDAIGMATEWGFGQILIGKW